MQSTQLKTPKNDIKCVQISADDTTSATTRPLRSGRKVSRETLLNRINFLHFQSAPLVVLFEHRRHSRTLRLNVYPQPCVDETLTCLWGESLPPSVKHGDFALRYLEVPHGQHVLRVEIKQPSYDETGIKCQLPEICQELSARNIKRHFCSNIDTQVIQNGAIFSGTLVDFSAAALRMDIVAPPPKTVHWLAPEEPVTVLLARNGETILTIPGRVLRRNGGRHQQSIVIQPNLLCQRRFPSKTHRNRRVEFRPTPLAAFQHPLTGKRLSLDVIDLSGSGFAVTEDPTEAQLLPGMLLNDLELCLTDSLRLSCHAQVIYTQEISPDKQATTLRSGLAILDMDIPQHTQLMALLHRAENSNKSVSPQVDIDRLWEFFFSSGFIYPQKYQSLQDYREIFRDTYDRLYSSSPEIARHFIYHKNNTIAGHLSMLRLCSNSWLIHHHASDRSRSQKGGLEALQLVGEAVNEAKSMCSAHMDYVMCYYRPENRFPHRVFGGVANHYADPSACSVDTFSYFHYSKEYDLRWKDGGPWKLSPAQEDDYLDLAAFYGEKSGGLMLKGLDLTAEKPDDKELNDSYQKAGFQRQHAVFTLKRDDVTAAVFMLIRTQVGLNLSNLSNAITVLVLDPKALPREAFFTAISMLASGYSESEIPILTYPADYAGGQAIEVEKEYNLWVLDCHNLDPYFDFCNNYFQRFNRSQKDQNHDT